MKITTWNINSLNVRLPHVLRYLEESRPDVLCLQELKLDQEKFPLAAVEEAGFQAAWYGQKTYNGVAIIAKETPRDVVCGLPGYEDAQRRVIAATVNGVRVINVYCVNGEAVGSEKFAYKEAWFAALRDYVAAELVRYPKLVLLGDFNIAPADIDVHDPKRWREKILCSTPERAWLAALTDLGLCDAVRTLHPETPHYSWWDYRLNAFERGWGLRIDLVLVSPELSGCLKDGGCDTVPRGWERPSDHAPVWVELALE